MSRSNRARRAAKRRARATSTGRDPRGVGPTCALEGTALVLVEAARAHWAGVPLPECVEPLLPLWDLSRPVVAAAADLVAADLIEDLSANGWTAVDIAEMARRRLDAALATLLNDAVAASSDPAVRVGWDGMVRVHGLVTLLAELLRWPPLAVPDAEACDEAESAMLAKVRALLAKAESTEFAEEAEALTAKAQQLMAKHAIDRALLDAPEAAAATLRRIWIDAPYVEAKALLVDVVAQANRCRAIASYKLGFSTVLGEAGDVRATILLATSLQLQAIRAMAYADRGGAQSRAGRTRSFRQSFLVAYAHRIGERLAQVTADATAAADPARLLPVLSARSRAADEALAKHFPGFVLRSLSSSNWAGIAAGRAAADLAQLEIGSALDRAG